MRWNKDQYLSLQGKSFCHFLIKWHCRIILTDAMINCLVTTTKFLVLNQQRFISLSKYSEMLKYKYNSFNVNDNSTNHKEEQNKNFGFQLHRLSRVPYQYNTQAKQYLTPSSILPQFTAWWANQPNQQCSCINKGTTTL